MATEIASYRPNDLSEGGPALVVARVNAGANVLERYIHGTGGQGVFEQGEQLVSVARPEPLTVLDSIESAEVSRGDTTFHLSFTIYRYGGDLAANVETAVLVQAELGRLAPGAYQVEATERIRWFVDVRHPEHAEPAERFHRLVFEVR